MRSGIYFVLFVKYASFVLTRPQKHAAELISVIKRNSEEHLNPSQCKIYFLF